MIFFYVESKDFKKKNLLELVGQFNKQAGYNINKQNSITFLYTSNERFWKKIFKNIFYSQ